MAVNIEIIGDKAGNEEYYAGEYLYNMFTAYFDNKNDIGGKILIKPNFRAPGEQREDIDIVVWMRFENFRETFATKSKSKVDDEIIISENKTLSPVYMNSFLFVIELKSHNRDGVIFSNTEVRVKYNGKTSSVTEQNEQQSYSLKNYISKNAKELNGSPYINRLIWLRSFDPQSKTPFGCNVVNLLFGDFSFKTLIETTFSQNPPFKAENNRLSYTAYFNRDENVNADKSIENIFLYYDKFFFSKQGTLTRKKLENLVQRELDETNKRRIEEIGIKTTIIQGVPGSGKTIHLLHLAYHLAKEKGKRCLILTYNIALNADIDRLSILSGFKDDPSSATVGTNTCVRLMRKFFIAWGIYQEAPTELNQNQKSRYIKINFLDKYEILLKELNSYLNEDILSSEEINKTKVEIDELNWDIVFVDESQDWYPEERDILYKLYGAHNFVIAYGSHQLVRQLKPLDWTKGTQLAPPINLEQSFRQKMNLCFFINAFSESIDFNRKIKINDNLNGGGIFVFTRSFNIEDYQTQLNYCVKECKNAAYDLLILVNNTSDGLLKTLKNHSISFHDGTQNKNKGKYPSNVEASRLYNYKSCRGLEGWTVVASNLDQFIENEYNITTEAKTGLSLEETRQEHIANWLYMIFSRAIDRLIITLKNPNTKYSKIILQIAEEKDYAQIVR
ncbi:DEAD/DEAH box helicase family protein [Flavobacteriaceae bacterium]|nr:DEAD/DEAH box helicase family protein [Flavobacteriaceae bacterium]